MPHTPPAMAPVRHEVRGRTIVLSLPEKPYDAIVNGKYQAGTWPNARLAFEPSPPY